MKQITQFKDVLFDCIGLTFSEQKLSKNVLIYKRFEREKNSYYLISSFNRDGEFIVGFLYKNSKAELLTSSFNDFIYRIKSFKEKNYACQ